MSAKSAVFTFTLCQNEKRGLRKSRTYGHEKSVRSAGSAVFTWPLESCPENGTDTQHELNENEEVNEIVHELSKKIFPRRSKAATC